MCKVCSVCLSVLVLIATARCSPLGKTKTPENSSDLDIKIPRQGVRHQELLDSEPKSTNPVLPEVQKLSQENKISTEVKISEVQINKLKKVSQDVEDVKSGQEHPDLEKIQELKRLDGDVGKTEKSHDKDSTSYVTEMTMEKTLRIESQKQKIPNNETEKIRFSDEDKIPQTPASSPSSEQNRTEGKPELKASPPDLAPGAYVFYQSANGSFKLHRAPATWTEARLMCYDEGAELASPENDALLAAMSKVLLTSRQPPLRVFTGVNDLYAKGFFTSLRGTPLSAMPTQWAPREPDNVNHGENCLVMLRNGLLQDGKCDDFYPYICYKRLKTNINLCGTTDTEYVFDKQTKSCYKLHSQFVSWQEAYATCAREGAYLAILNSDYEAKTLANMIKKEWIWAHIGFSYWRKGLWVTLHGETIASAGFESWVPGEPNDWNEERCGCLSADLAQMVDIDCVDHTRPFICEITAL